MKGIMPSPYTKGKEEDGVEKPPRFVLWSSCLALTDRFSTQGVSYEVAQQ